MAKWKKSQDPKQDAIRQAKAEYSEKTSELIDDFLNIKKFINGVPNKFYSNKTPLHKINNVVSKIEGLLSSILSKYNETSSKVSAIIDAQEDYSWEASNKPTIPAIPVVTARVNPYLSIIEVKKQWNAKSRDFIKNIIQFKKLINGIPSDFHNNKSKITDIIPADSKSILNKLNESFKSLINDAYVILKKQVETSAKPKEKAASVLELVDEFIIKIES